MRLDPRTYRPRVEVGIRPNKLDPGITVIEYIKKYGYPYHLVYPSQKIRADN